MTRSIGGWVFPVILGLVLAFPGNGGESAFAQSAGVADDQAPSEEELLEQQTQSAGLQVLSNMVANGVNPAQFMAEVFSAMPAGGFDPDVLREKLIDHNLIDRDTLDRIHTLRERVVAVRMQRDLGIAGEEAWKALLAKIQKVLDTGYAAGVRNPRLSVLGLRPKISGKTELEKAMAAVKAALKNPDTTPKEFLEKLTACRDAKEKARADYVEAQKELIAACTLHQESALVAMGLVE